MLHPDTRLDWISDEIGYGVVATKPLPRGTISWVKDPLDRLFSPAETAALSPVFRNKLDRYAYLRPDKTRLLCWDHGRFMNHSCAPNCLSTGWELEVVVRDIAAGEEVTSDYAYLNLEEPFECGCGHEACRHEIQPEDFGRLADHWDGQIQAAFPLVGAVPQALWECLEDEALVNRAISDPRQVPSVLLHRLLPETE